MNNIKSTVKSLGIGRLAYICYHRPKNQLHDLILEGGPLQRRRTIAGRSEMVAAADRLPVQPIRPDAAHEVWFMTDQKYWFQSAFCAATLLHHSELPIRPVFFGDGRFDEATRAKAERTFPGCRIIPDSELTTALDARFPRERYPMIRAQRERFITFGKMLDIHALEPGWKLFLDSDMLFFKRPVFIEQWLQNPDKPCYMLDVMNSFGWSMPLLESLAGGPIPDRLNVGMLGLRTEDLDFDQIERILTRLVEAEGPRYYIDQALAAILLARVPCAVAPDADYRTLPTRHDVYTNHLTMHHYVAHSKRWYFQKCWRDALNAMGAMP